MDTEAPELRMLVVLSDLGNQVAGGYSFDPPLRSPNVKMSGPPEAPARAKK
jgi:hypothetical protein